MAASASTIDIKYKASSGTTREIHLPAQHFPLDARHDLDRHHHVAWSTEYGPGGQPLAVLPYTLTADEVVWRFENISDDDHTAVELMHTSARDFNEAAAGGGITAVTFQIAPAGVASYSATGWVPTATQSDWQRDQYGRWSGELRFVRAGSAL